jgi:hypothetical protein
MMLALALAKRGHDVMLVDADPGTQGVTDWATRVYANGGELPVHVVQWTHTLGLLVPFIQQQQRQTGARRVVIDVGGEAPDVVRQAVHLADLVISPVGAEQAELGRLPATRALMPDDVRMFVALTRVPAPGIGAAAAARDALTAGGYHVLAAETKQQREVYADVWGTVPTDLAAYDDLTTELLAEEARP